MSVSPVTRYIRDKRHAFPVVGALAHNNCMFRLCRSGALVVYVPHTFFEVRDQFVRLVFLTSFRVGTEFVVHTPTNFDVINERVLGYIVVSSSSNLAVWTKPFNVGGNQHLHNFLFKDTIAFMHLSLDTREHFFAEVQTFQRSLMVGSQLILFKCGKQNN